METFTSYQMAGKLNSYHWALLEVGAEVHAFQDFGSYQGDWLAKVTYKGKTGWIHDYYGSCSGCDNFEDECDNTSRTKKAWHSFAVKFCKDYLDDIRTYEDVLETCSKNTNWDTDAKDMIKFLKENK